LVDVRIEHPIGYWYRISGTETVQVHLEQFTGPDDDSLVFTGPTRAPVRRSNFSGIWRKAIAAGLSGIHIHDLRHAGNHFAASTGASLAELMGRMDHSTTRAALIYQPRTIERDRIVGAAISAAVEAELTESERASGTSRTRNDQEANCRAFAEPKS
jgi:integrase